MERLGRNFRMYGSSGRLALLLMGATLSCASAVAQPGTGATIVQLPSAQAIINRDTNPFSGSTPQGTATAETIEISVEDALDRGLKYNLGAYLSNQTSAEARAAQIRSLSNLLPHVSGSFGEELQRINLKAFGFKFAGFPSSVGPFGLTATSASGTWDLLNLSSIDKYRASGETVKAAEFSYLDARDTVVLTVGANYLLVIAQESRVEATRAELETAQALYQLASDQETAGLVPNIDTLRARVQLQAQQEALITAQNDLEKQRIALARVIGLPIHQKYKLVNRVPYHPVPEALLGGATDLALQTRPDYKAAQSQLRAAQLRREAAWKGRLPSVAASGTYGVLGYTPNAMAPQYTAAATLNIPIFEGGKVRADVQETEAILKERQAQVDNLKARIEQEVEVSLLDLKAASQQVEVARIGLDLAQQVVAQSQDRFAAGVTNNVEVIQAQQSLAAANDQYIASLYGHNIAKVLLARAVGNTEQVVKQYLAGDSSPLGQPAVVPAAPPTDANSPNTNVPPQPK